MKKMILLLLSITVGFTVYGQTDYYTGQTRVAGKNVTYLCENHETFYRIRNVNNVLYQQPVKMRDGTPADEGPAMRYDFGMNDPNHSLLHRAFRETFAPEQITAIQAQKPNATIYFYADPAGITKELLFLVTKTSATASIPPDQWFTLEQKLKQYVTAKQEIAKNYQFSVYFINFSFDEL